MQPTRISIDHPEGVITGWHFPASSAQGIRKNRILFLHATGFCASAYRQIFQQGKLDADVWALDLRGHGKTELPTNPAALKSWHVYADDTGYVLDKLNEELDGANDAYNPWVLAGHSMGGVTATMVAAQRDDVAGLALLEPVAMPQVISTLAGTPLWPSLKKRFPLAVSSAKRRDRWANAQEVLASYQSKPFFSNWSKGMLEDYLLDGLIQDEQGVRLACSPAWEAATFGAQANPFWHDVGTIGRHLKAGKMQTAQVLAGNLSSSTVLRASARRLQRNGFQFMREASLGHLIAMETPHETVAFLKSVYEKCL